MKKNININECNSKKEVVKKPSVLKNMQKYFLMTMLATWVLGNLKAEESKYNKQEIEAEILDKWHNASDDVKEVFITKLIPPLIEDKLFLYIQTVVKQDKIGFYLEQIMDWLETEEGIEYIKDRNRDIDSFPIIIEKKDINLNKESLDTMKPKIISTMTKFFKEILKTDMQAFYIDKFKEFLDKDDAYIYINKNMHEDLEIPFLIDNKDIELTDKWFNDMKEVILKKTNQLKIWTQDKNRVLQLLDWEEWRNIVNEILSTWKSTLLTQHLKKYKPHTFTWAWNWGQGKDADWKSTTTDELSLKYTYRFNPEVALNLTGGYKTENKNYEEEIASYNIFNESVTKEISASITAQLWEGSTDIDNLKAGSVILIWVTYTKWSNAVDWTTTINWKEYSWTVKTEYTAWTPNASYSYVLPVTKNLTSTFTLTAMQTLMEDGWEDAVFLADTGLIYTFDKDQSLHAIGLRNAEIGLNYDILDDWLNLRAGFKWAIYTLESWEEIYLKLNGKFSLDWLSMLYPSGWISTENAERWKKYVIAEMIKKDDKLVFKTEDNKISSIPMIPSKYSYDEDERAKQFYNERTDNL